MAMNRRGRRSSGPIRAGHSLDVEYGDVAAVVTSIAGPVHLLGHSSGARFALHAALRAPELASLILYEPPASERLPAEVLAALGHLEAVGDRYGILRLFLLDVLDNTEEDLELIQQRPIWPIMLDNALTLPAELGAARQYRLEPSALAELTVPTTLLVGELSSPEAKTAAREVVEAIPGASIVILPGQGHGAMFSAPELFASEVARLVGT